MTGISRNETCASCTRFPRETWEATGRAVCKGLEEERHYSFPACPLHIGSKGEERRARKILVDRLNEQK